MAWSAVVPIIICYRLVTILSWFGGAFTIRLAGTGRRLDLSGQFKYSYSSQRKTWGPPSLFSLHNTERKKEVKSLLTQPSNNCVKLITHKSKFIAKDYKHHEHYK